MEQYGQKAQENDLSLACQDAQLDRAVKNRNA